ncbi:hypothetical protein ACTU3I_13155 [Microbacterium sp. RD1]|uniref:hypothetical protein n=1 Tax=Microbacterium sp. RD1 TaxID=3457313 RepID=UPI003FA533EE
MGLGQTLRALQRRWYVLLVGLIVTGLLGLWAWQATPPTYVAHGTQLLLPPAAQVEAGTRNPLLELSSLDAPASLIIGQLDGQAVREQVVEESPDAEYVVETDPSLRGPTVLVTMSDTTAKKALASLEYVLNLVPGTLEQLQADLEVPAPAIVTSMRLTTDLEPEPEYSNTLRTLVVAIGAGLVVTIVLAVALDGLLRRRAVKRANAPAKKAPSEAQEPEPDEDDEEQDGLDRLFDGDSSQRSSR